MRSLSFDMITLFLHRLWSSKSICIGHSCHKCAKS